MELESCSQKVFSRATEPKFMGSEQDCDECLKATDHFLCHFHFPNSNGEITVYGKLSNEGQNKVIREARYFTNIKGAPLAFIDALIELSHKRDAHSLPLLRIKEVESFLRDKNSVPSFPDEGVQLYRYYEVIHALQSSISRKLPMALSDDAPQGKRSPGIEEYKPHSVLIYDQVQMGKFVDLNTELKVQFVNDILTCHVRPLLQRDGGDVECIHVMENMVVILFHGNCGTCGMSLTTTMDFIKKVLRTELFESSLDIITDS